MSVATDILSRVDEFSGTDVNYKVTAIWSDGSPMTDLKTDGTLYKKKNGIYYKREFESTVCVDWFGAVADGVTDDSEALQKAFNSDYDLHFTSGKRYLVSQKIHLPAKNLYEHRVHYVNGNGALIICNVVDGEIFNGAQGTDLFTAKWVWERLNFTQKPVLSSTIGKCTAFNLDRLYNQSFVNCGFRSIHTAFKSVEFIQSVDIKCHFVSVYFQLDSKRCYNLSVLNNFSESCLRGFVISGDGDPDANTLRISDNVFEGGNIPQITLGSCYSAKIDNNYFEGNIGDSEILLNSAASPYRGLEISGNSFQPTPSQIASGTYCPISVDNPDTFIEGASPRIVGNVTTGSKIISTLNNVFYDSNFELQDYKPFRYQKNHNINGVYQKFIPADLKSNIGNYVNPYYKLFKFNFTKNGNYTINLKGRLVFFNNGGYVVGNAFIEIDLMLLKTSTDIRTNVISAKAKNVEMTLDNGNQSVGFINMPDFEVITNSDYSFSFGGFIQQSTIDYGLVDSTVFEGLITVISPVYDSFDFIQL